MKNFKTLEYQSRDRRNGRSKSNSLNPQKSYTVRNSKEIIIIIYLDWDEVTHHQNFLPQSLTEIQLVKEFKQFSENSEGVNQRYYTKDPPVEEMRNYMGDRANEDQTIIKSSLNPLKTSVQQSNEKSKMNHEERYEGSTQSIEETPYYNNIEESFKENEKSELDGS